LKEERSVFSNRDFFAGIILSSLVFLAASLIPLVGSAFFILTPLPILYYYTKIGRIQGWGVFIISLALVALFLTFFGSISSFPFLFISGLLGIILSEILHKNYSIERTIIYPVTVLITLWFIVTVSLSLILGKQPWHLIEDYIGKNIQESINFYTQLDIPAEQIAPIRDNIKQITIFFTNIFPALFLVSVSLTVWINTLAARDIFFKNRMTYPDFGNLSCWRAPESLIWILIASGVMLLIPAEWAKFVGLNLLIVCLFVYLLQGLSIISFIFKTKNVHRLFRISCYFLIFTLQYIILVVIAVGVVDLWIDFRKFLKPIPKSNV
jgi:uncharacterized protein YybS (DUF2232 family)